LLPLSNGSVLNSTKIKAIKEKSLTRIISFDAEIFFSYKYKVLLGGYWHDKITENYTLRFACITNPTLRKLLWRT
jgi:hypothetical protein